MNSRTVGVLVAALVVVVVVAAVIIAITGGEDGSMVSATTFEGDWPLTVDSGTMRCEDNAPIFVAPDGTEYGLNALAESRGYTSIEPIWREGVSTPKADLDPLVKAALDEC